MRRWLFAAGLVLPLCASGTDGETVLVRIKNTAGEVHHLRVEVAATPEARARGLMARDTLAPDAGMLFLYQGPQPGNAGFWMYNTRIPLDIAFLDGDGRIVAIHNMDPCPHAEKQRCPVYRPRVAYTAALEVNGGYFSARAIHPGDRVIFNPHETVGVRQ